MGRAEGNDEADAGAANGAPNGAQRSVF